MTRLILQSFMALLGLAASVPARAQMEGTLFTSPEQRAYMDFLRQDFLSRSAEVGFDIAVPEIPDVPNADTTDTAAAPEGPTEFTLGGIMTGRDGARSVWLNNNLLPESELPQWARIVAEGAGLALQLDANGTRWLLRPGQTVDLASGTVSEAYQRSPPQDVAAPAEGLAALVEAVASAAAGNDADAGTATTPETPPTPLATAVEETAPAVIAPAGTSATVLPERPLDELDVTELDALIESLQERRANIDEE